MVTTQWGRIPTLLKMGKFSLGNGNAVEMQPTMMSLELLVILKTLVGINPELQQEQSNLDSSKRTPPPSRPRHTLGNVECADCTLLASAQA